MVGHIRQSRFHLHVVPRRIESEHSRLTAGWPNKVEQALDRGRLAGSIPSEEAVTAARLHLQVQSVDRVGVSEASNQIADLDGVRLVAHKSLMEGAWVVRPR